MPDLILTTYDWVPPPPRGYVRDLRIRWALEEAGLPYRVASTPFEDRGPDHLAHQPFAQVPWLTDGDLSIFESGAIALHLGGLSETLMPRDAAGRAKVTEWVFAALNSMEMPSLPWTMFHFMGMASGPQYEFVDGFLKLRLERLTPVLQADDWLAGRFSVADILMADVLRVVDRFGGLADYPFAAAYLARATARPAFQKAYDDQMAHFAAGDADRAKSQ